MKVVKIKKELLYEALYQNRAKHEAEYKENLAEYQKLVTESLARRYKDAIGGKSYEPNDNIQRPINYLKEYDRVIQMLGYSAEDIVELDSAEFSRYVNDEWEWKSIFNNISASYKNFQ